MRTGKAVTTSTGAATYTYVYENGLLQKMTRGSRTLEFSYDANGNPVSLAYRNSTTATPVYYYYGLNSRGDVIALYNSTGSLYATYTYDAYGKFLGAKNSAGVELSGDTNIAILNPLRYRSYVYDTETGFYYLQTRYYDPTTCRFINADGQLNTDSANGFNMFAYCNGNPIQRCDPSGRKFWDDVGDFFSKCWETGKAIFSSINIEFGAGYGIGISAGVCEIANLALEASANLVHFKTDGTNVDVGSKYSTSLGIESIGPLKHNFLKEAHFVSAVTETTYNDSNEDNEIEIFSTSLYLGIGFSFDVSVNKDLNDKLYDIWS